MKGAIRIEWKVLQTVGGMASSNVYLAGDETTGKGFIVDAGADADAIRRLVERSGIAPVALLLTHGHFDHIEFVDEIREAFDIKAYISAADAPMLGSDSLLNGSFLFGVNKAFRPPDGLLEEGRPFDAGGIPVTVLHTPGHTPGGLCFYLPKSKVCFTGDTIFNVDLGYTHFPGGSAERMRDSLKNVVNTWGNDITIYPGHGDPASMKYVRAVNTEFLEMIQ